MTEKKLNLVKSKELQEKAHALIPGGAHTYSKGDDQFPIDYPGFLERGEGCKTWDVDNNEYIDYGMGLRSVVLGYHNARVDDAVIKAIKLGPNFTRPHPVEVELAEVLTKLIPSAEMVIYGKNGSTVTTAAVKLARAYT